VLGRKHNYFSSGGYRMSDYHKLLAVVQNNNLDDKERNAALAKLIENGAVEQLNQVVCDKKRSREMHDVASRAILKTMAGW
jgi:hypothetical protein